LLLAYSSGYLAAILRSTSCRAGLFTSASTSGSARRHTAALKRAFEQGWLVLRESGTFVRFTQAGADLFA
jgi:hypothetical protein